jgi:hypothetical protein
MLRIRLLGRTMLAAFVASAVAAGAPAIASASVLIQAIPHRLACGDAITPGIWAQPGTTGPKTVRISAIDKATGRTWWHKKATAPTSGWRNWTLPSGRDGQCGATTIVYRGPGFTKRYTVRFASEGV